MRVAVSGSHGTGKSTLIDAFLERRPSYVHEPEAFETLGDEVDLTDGVLTLEALERLLLWTVEVVAGFADGANVIHERSPVDYLAYAAASRRSWAAGSGASFATAVLPAVRDGLRHLDLIAFLPVSSAVPERPGEDARFRRRVDRALRRVLLDGEHDLFTGTRPTVVELPEAPDRRLAALLALVPA
jgi:hypothetical protein